MTTHYGHFDPYELDNSPNPLTGDAWGGYYCRHVSALTTECLHAKSEIAAELGWRDLQIDRLRAELTEARKDADRYRRLCSLVAWGAFGVCRVQSNEEGDDYADDGEMLDAWLDDPEMIAEAQAINAAMAGGEHG